MRKMVNIARTRGNSRGGSPRTAEVGEIDTNAPIRSVKAAVSLFGEAPKITRVISKKAKSQTEGVLEKEAQFHIALNKLNKVKEELRGAESARAETVPELDKAKRTLEELKQKLKLVNESKKSIVVASEALKSKARKLEKKVADSGNQNVETKREAYKAATTELDAAKQELSNMRTVFATISEAKLRAVRKSQQAQKAVEAHRERVKDLSKQITAMQEALAEIKASSKKMLQEHEEVLAKKDEELRCCKLAKEEVEKKLVALKTEHQPLLAENLEPKLAETSVQIASLQEEVKNARAAFLEAQTVELETAKGSLKQVEEEKVELQNSAESLKKELEHVSKELSDLQKCREDEAEALASRLRAEIDDKKKELEAVLVNKKSADDDSYAMVSSLEQVTMDTRRAKQEAEEIKKTTEEQRQIAKNSRQMTTEMEDKLPSLLKEAEEAKFMERAGQDQIKVASEKADVAQTSGSEGDVNGKINLSREKYNLMMEKANGPRKLAEVKVAATTSDVEALVANQKEAAKKYEACSKAIEELKLAEEEALKVAKMAEAATSALEGELQRMHQQEEINKTAQLN